MREAERLGEEGVGGGAAERERWGRGRETDRQANRQAGRKVDREKDRQRQSDRNRELLIHCFPCLRRFKVFIIYLPHSEEFEGVGGL